MIHCEIHRTDKVLGAILEMVPEHYADACETNEYEPIEIDTDYFRNVSAQNQCFTVTLNAGGEMVGYAVFTLQSDPLRKNTQEAVNTCLFVKKGFRGIGTKRLLDSSANLMKELGADKITYAIKNKALERILSHGGFKPQETVWSLAL